MLSRVSRQKNALFHLRKANAIRALGASSPMAARLHSNPSQTSPVVNTLHKPSKERSRRLSLQLHRNLATAADQSALDQPSSYVPLNQPPFSPSIDGSDLINYSSPFRQRPNSFDSSSLVIVNEIPSTQQKVFRKRRGIGGDEEEMLANFDMSLRVGRFDRAAALIDRLKSFYSVDSHEFLVLHNRYLEQMVSHMIVTRQSEMVLPLQKWFEVDMPHAGVTANDFTFAVMIRMALRMLHGSKRDRTVRRYWDLAKKAGLEEDLLAVEVLTDLDLGELSKVRIFSTFFVMMDPFPSHDSLLNDPKHQICSYDLLPTTFEEMKFDESPIPDVRPADNTPEVLATRQKGLGLSSLQASLSSLADMSQIALPQDFQGTEQEREDIINQFRQQKLETDTMTTASNRWRKEFEQRSKVGVDMSSGNSKLSHMIGQWHTGLAEAIRNEIKLAEEEEGKPIRNEEQAARCEYSVFLQALDPDRLAAVTIISTIDAFTRGGIQKGVKVSGVATRVGEDIKDELLADTFLKKNVAGNFRRAQMLKEMLANRRGKDGRMRWKALSENLQKEEPQLAWTPRVVVRTGAVLMGLLFNVAKASVRTTDATTGKNITTTQPAFLHSYEIHYGKRLGLFYMNPDIVEKLTKEPPADMLSRHLPMISKPRPWTGAKTGGYHVYQSSIVRTTPGETLQPAYIDAALENGGLKEIRNGLNVLGNTGWVVNREVFDVMLEAWNSGEAIGNLAPVEPDLKIPPKPAADAGYEAEKEWNVKMRDIENLRSGFHSMRCFQNFQLEVARSFRDETFYLPHNMDFRGRAYPLPPYLNQMGSDNARGLLLFSKAKPLGVSGLRWLKIQIANLAGFDKASMSEREQFAMDHLDEILDSANKGLHGKRWWLKAEDPWQCLAACLELRNALRYSDPTEYPSRLPIHQDGSCNGLQHYAALGGDKVGAQQVNLEPSDRPSDVYTGVSEFVKKSVAKEAAEGHEIARLLNGKITRKIVKQTVMTNVYGVTFIGAMRQVRKQLNDHYPELSTEMRKAGALYIARKIFEALGSMFNGAHDIQYWLGDCATRITQSLTPEQIETLTNEALSPSKDTPKALDPTKRFQTTVIWTTPLGLPVVQPYRTRKARRVFTSLQSINIVDPTSEATVSRRKQLQAFPPNFIHSLDATHMMLSANACNEAGLTFSAVHDSFWTHAGDVDTMNSILRDAFVRMHSDDVIGRLDAEFKVRFGKNMLLAKVATQSAVGRAINAYRKRNARGGKLPELIQENRRQTLLRSDDPADQAEGRAMVTPASIFEEMGATDDDLSIASTLGETSVGHVPKDLDTAERSPSANVDTSDPAIESLFTEVDMMDPNAASKADVDLDEPAEAEGVTLKSKAQTKKRSERSTWLWLPLTFRPVPAKGEWDLTRIRNSQYFFS
ncbi:hypothetical protein N7462_004868 [Penicillium macrosclerotiorum]|uniref:uncharacterized protein n=1 Tax=Penicillium macrosclerotiorum TaxID=303699 RepID=UPI002546A8B4|nr:uncharacterized protein N7462_004868 [Penicillium macrosclerotiorum]KAJ5690476.1 hypothetical protein N7462_004868 [Penicillium macrosclerotiorum]